VLYSFTGSSGGDGLGPYAGVTIGNAGVLFGTTYYGGTNGCVSALGCGTVFSLTPPVSSGAAWTETVLHSFTGGSDGFYPFAGVVIGNGGVLYGTTLDGGYTGPSCVTACGGVFSLTPPSPPGAAWTETVLHNFPAGASDGVDPYGGLVIGKGGVFYGTAWGGGPSGLGAVFELRP
jgi:hypothetical protein